MRRFAALSGLFLVAEALLGAGLVWLGFVAHNASIGRAFYMPAHLTNTLVLLAVIALTAWSARELVPPLKFRGKSKVMLAEAPVAPVLYVTGALAALKSRPTPQGRRHATGVMGMVFVQLIAGAVNLALLAPVWMQIVHLLLADLLWIALVILLAEAFAERPSLKHQLAREG